MLFLAVFNHFLIFIYIYIYWSIVCDSFQRLLYKHTLHCKRGCEGKVAPVCFRFQICSTNACRYTCAYDCSDSLYLMLLSYCFKCSEIWEIIGTNDCFLEYRITCEDEEERASRRVYRGCIRSPTCKGCTSCVCFGCEICRFSDCSCQTCIDFTRNAKTWISELIFSTWLFLYLVGFFMTIVVSWKPLPSFKEAICHALVWLKFPVSAFSIHCSHWLVQKLQNEAIYSLHLCCSCVPIISILLYIIF